MASTPDPLSSERVHEFVRIAHFDFDGVRAFLEDEPQLVNAAWTGVEVTGRRGLALPRTWGGVTSPNCFSTGARG
jgi:hypothetical protein